MMKKKNPMQQLTYDASMMLFCHVLITKKENNIGMKNRRVMGLGIFPPIRHGMVGYKTFFSLMHQIQPNTNHCRWQ